MTPSRAAGDERRLEHATSALAAIRSGDVDGVVGGLAGSEQVYTRTGAEHIYRVLVERLADGVLTATEDGTVLYATRGFAMIAGRPLEHVIGKPLADVVAPDDLDRLQRLLAAGSPAVEELAIARGDGTTAPVRLSTSALGDPYPASLCIAVTDLTEVRWQQERLAEANARLRFQAEALVEANRRFRTVFEEGPLPMAKVDRNGCYIAANPAWCELAGRDPEEVVGRPAGAFLHDDDRAAHLAALDDLAGGRAPRRHLEERVVRPGGETRRTSTTLGVVTGREAGAFLYCLELSEDVTERVRAAEDNRIVEQKLAEAQKLESLGVLAGGIAHDFNNLLGVILGNASFALDGVPDGASVRPQLELIEDAAGRASELAQQMLAYAGKGSFTQEPLSLSRLVGETAQLLESGVSKKAGLELIVPDDVPSVSGDAAQLRRVVLNLVHNASDALEGRAGAITVETGAVNADRAYLSQFFGGDELAEGSYAWISVSDTGVGMDAPTQARMFEPFFTTKSTGRGLGLAAALGIVRAHGGASKVYSEPGIGTAIKLVFPAATGGSPPPPRAGRADEDAGDWRGSGVAVVADDEPGVRRTACELLEVIGFSAVPAADGVEALEALERHRGEVALVLLDLTMPRLGGDEVLDELDRRGDTTPVILSSGYSVHEVERRSSLDRSVTVLQKPYRFEALRAAARAVLEAHANGRPAAPAGGHARPQPAGE